MHDYNTRQLEQFEYTLTSGAKNARKNKNLTSIKNNADKTTLPDIKKIFQRRR